MSAAISALSSLNRSPDVKNTNKINVQDQIRSGFQNLMLSQQSNDRNTQLSQLTGKKLIAGGFGANGIPHGIND